jgi:hypothetical protein
MILIRFTHKKIESLNKYIKKYYFSENLLILQKLDNLNNSDILLSNETEHLSWMSIPHV